jgi:hypothetical protein
VSRERGVRSARYAVVVAALIAACAATAGVTWADGDPASDVLVYENVYLPYQAPSRTAAAALARQVSSVYASADRIKVAVIAATSDLGAVPSLFGKPADYAAFLGQELDTVFIGPLLIVMPTGYGIYDGGRSVAAEQAVLQRLALPSSSRPDDLVAAATTAVASLLKAGALTSSDILHPYVTTLGSVYKNGRLTIRFYVYDDSGRVSLAAAVTQADRKLFQGAIRSAPSTYTKVQTHTFRVRRGLALAGARLCLTATDAAGNNSSSSCRNVCR